MDHNAFTEWIEKYGRSWEAKDTEAFVGIFTPDVKYHWTPFGNLKNGREELRQAFADATSTQENPRFSYDILCVTNTTGVAHWRCTVVRSTTGQEVTIDGMMLCTFDSNDLCSEFREWWHSTELE